MKIFFYALRDFDELPYAEQFSKEYGIEFGWTADYPDENNIALAKGYDAISCVPCRMDAEVVNAFADEGVKYIACRSIGYDHVDLAQARKRNMKVSNVSYPGDSVADYAIMLLMMASRKTAYTLERAKLQDYSLKGKLGRNITSLKVGVIGTGRIGTTVLRHLSGFGNPLLAYDLYQNEEAKKYATYVDLDTMLKEADAITIHANVTKEDTHLLDEEAFKKMKKGMIIVNTSRGKLIDTKALINALKDGTVESAALDVLENENGLYYYNRMGDVIDNDEMAVLRAMPNVILTPHTAFYTRTDVMDMVKSVFEAVDAYGRGEETPHDVTNR